MNKENQQALPGVHISVDGLRQGVVTDAKGAFSFSGLPAGTHSLVFSFLGFSRQALAVAIQEGQTLTLDPVWLQEETFSLDEITVTPGQFSIMGEAPLSRQTLSEEDIKNMSWAEDITRVVARLPGISSTDYSSKFTIRGGEADEVLITLDGMELYEPFHQRDFSGGLFSIVDVQAIQGIELMTGGFSAANGNRLSGVFNMKTRNVRRKRHTSLGLSMMNARLYTEGTFAKNKGSYLFSARRGMLDLIFKAIGNTENLPFFYDTMGKVEYDLNPKHRLSLHVLHAGDRAAVRDVSETNYDIHNTKYGNSYGWLRLQSNYTSKLFSQTLIYTGMISHNRQGSFNKDDTSDKGSFRVSDQRDYSLLGIKQDWDWQVSDKFYFQGGFEAKQIRASYDYVSNIQDLRVDADARLYQYSEARNIQLKPSGQQVSAYASGRYKLLKRLMAETGIRYDQASYTGDQLWSPRLGLAYAFSGQTFLRAAWGYYYQTQFINNIDVNHGNLHFDPAELAKHYVLGFEHQFQNGILFRTEAYYKQYTHLSPSWQNMRDHLEVWPESRDDNAQIIFSSADTKGIELFMKYDQGKKFTYWLSYALAKAEDDIRNIEFDGLLNKRTGKVPRLNNQRHSVYADLNYRPNLHWHFNLSWTYYVGWPRTTYTYHYTKLPDGRDHFYIEHKEFNGEVFPAYHRMDMRSNRYFNTRAGTITAFLHLVNVYNRQNLQKFDLDTTDDNENLSIDSEGNYIPFRDDKFWFGFLPVFGVSWEF